MLANNNTTGCTVADRQYSELEEILRRFESLTIRHNDVNLRLDLICSKLRPIEKDDSKYSEPIFMDSIIGKFNEGLEAYVNKIIKTEQLVSHLEKLI